jgi:hypothetical protein
MVRVEFNVAGAAEDPGLPKRRARTTPAWAASATLREPL